jgi:hypothetical protein
MSPRSSNKRAASPGPRFTPNPRKTNRSMRTVTLSMLVGIDVIVALMMIGSAVGFVMKPEPAVEAGPMYVTLALTTVAVVLMAFLAVDATFFPVLTRAQRANLSLVMWSMAATGVVTGILALGGAVNAIVMRLFVATLAYVFISVQRSRIERAQAAAPASGKQAAVSGAVRPTAAATPRPAAKSRQRKGGRKH